MPSSFRVILLHALFFLSGVAGLGYQLLWTRMLTTGLGHEMPSMLAVVAAFFGGLSLGAWLLDARIAGSASPGRWYAGLEAVIGVWGFVSIALIPLLSASAPRLIGIDAPAAWHWTVAFTIPFFALLPATMAMGATLPAMQRFAAPLTRTGRCIGSLYAANTCGALAGTLLSAFVLGPSLGMKAGIAILAAMNLGCAGATMLMLRSTAAMAKETAATAAPQQPGVAAAQDDSQGISPCEPRPARATRLHSPTFMLFFTGLLGIGFEALAVRAMSQVLENTVYSYAAALTVFLAGTAIGAAAYQRFGARLHPDRLLAWLLAFLSAACLLGVWQLGKAGALYALRRQEAGDSLMASFTAEMAIAASVLLLPALAMGAVFAHLMEAAKRVAVNRASGDAARAGIGAALAINTLGAAAAPLLFVVLLLPAIGIVASLIVVAAGYIALMMLPLLRAARPVGIHWLAPLIPAALLMPATATSLRPDAEEADHRTPAGQQVVEYREGVLASTAVLQSDAGKVLQINSRFNMGSTAAGAVVIQRCQGHIPLLLHPDPKSALFLGTATGITLGTVISHEGARADGVELLPEVAAVMQHFAPLNGWPYDGGRVTMHIADARRFVRASDEQYDVIVADLFHPAADGAGMLYTLEHFRAVRERLHDGGLFCQWLPLYQLDEATLKIIIRSFLEVFPESRAFIADFNIDLPALGLIGSRQALKYPLPWYPQRFAGRAAALAAIKSQEIRLEDDLRLLGRCVASAESLRQFSEGAPLNTDDHPRVLFDAPRAMARGEHSDHGLLMKLIAESDEAIAELDAGHSKTAGSFLQRLHLFIKARDVFMEGMEMARARAETSTSSALARYIESAAISEDFTYGYAHAITIALHTFQDNPQMTRTILKRLDEAQPRRPAARQWMKKLFPETPSP